MRKHTIEYQTEPEAVAEMHGTSRKFLAGLIAVAFILYVFCK